MNFTSNGTYDGEGAVTVNLTQLETFYSITATSVEGIDETFNSTNNITINTVDLYNCPSTHAYTNGSLDSSHWNQSMLTINNTHTVIFASVVEDNQWGYNNKSWDFQLLVADRSGNSPTTYYIYVELT